MIPAYDQSTPSDSVATASGGLPHNHEAEQAVLGILLYDLPAYERLPDGFKPEHFYEPFHQRAFAAVEEGVRKGVLVDAITLRDRFAADPAFEELGGYKYLADLVDKAPPPAFLPDYAKALMDLALRREVIRIGGDMVRLGQAGRDDEGAELNGRALVERAESKLYAVAQTGETGKGTVIFAEALDVAIDHMAEALSRDGALTGLSTGLLDMDRQLGGLHASDLLILAGRPSMGKTALATNIAFSIARNYAYEIQPDGTRKTVRGGIVAFYSLEMSADQLASRMLADASGVSSDRIRKGLIDPSEFARIRDARAEIGGAPLYINDTGGISLAKLCASARRQKRKTGLDLIVVDYLQLITTDYRSGRSRVDEVTEITKGLKALAKELNVPVVALSQLSRQVEQREDKRPQLSDLRESGSIEQDADAVMFVYREAYYLGRSEPREGSPEHLAWEENMARMENVAEVIISKQRHGPIGTVKLSFDAETVRFGNLARDDRYDDHQRPSRGPAPATPRAIYSYGGGE